ncbi:MAG: phage tail protein [Planctomycetaceae bacterium]|jgi:hypothetical protein|nr:phage tail protein [Planctomycetaceae bacterium]
MPGDTVQEKYQVGYQIPVIIEDIETISVGDVTASKSYTEIAIKRKGKRQVGYIKGMEDISIDFDLYDNGDPAVAVLKAAYNSDDPISIEIADISDDFIVTKLDKSEPVDDAVTISVTVKLSANSKPVENTQAKADTTTESPDNELPELQDHMLTA